METRFLIDSFLIHPLVTRNGTGLTFSLLRFDLHSLRIISTEECVISWIDGLYGAEKVYD